jgi:NAD(P)-dependent dehydrogenase (short-subunit alcohol dehydrogenase family)
MLSLKHELRLMRPQGSGAIVNLSSIVGHKALPGAPLYVASKHAVEGLTKAAALEAAEFGVRVNAVAPGPIETGMLDRFTGGADAKAGLLASLPLKRAGTPDEIARVIMFAASDAASYMTGCILAVDGGMTVD